MTIMEPQTLTDDHSDPANAGRIAQRIVELLAKADSTTRRRAIQAAMTLLGEGSDLGFAPPTALGGREKSAEGGFAESQQILELITKGDKLKPSDCAQLCVAHHYSQYGAVPFSLDEIRATAADLGVVIPSRLDMTLKSAISSGRKLFQACGKGMYKPTVTAELAFRERWGIRPGKSKKAGAELAEG